MVLFKVRVVFPRDGVMQQLSGEPGQPNQEIYVRSFSTPITLTPEEEDNKVKVTKLLKKLLNDSSSSDAGGGGSPVEGKTAESWEISIDMAIYTPISNVNCRLSEPPISSNPKVFLRVRDAASGGILERLSKIYGPGEIKLTVLFDNVKTKQLFARYPQLTQMNMTEEDLNYMFSLNSYGVEKRGDVLDSATVDEWKQLTPYEWNAIITIIAVVPDDWQAIDLSMTDKCYMSKKILQEQVFTDATIIAKNGGGVKCHKAFLAGHSSVLSTMFQTTMQESQTGTVEMPDMSEAGVRAFLAYLYYWDMKEAAMNSLICFELFAAGHKYDISQMENSMEKILLAKNNEWYDVDVAMKLFLFSRNLPNGDKLKMKAVQVLKSKSSDLSKSPCYHQLFKDDLEAAKDLCSCSFSV